MQPESREQAAVPGACGGSVARGVGAPQIPEISLSLPGGKTFTTKAQNLSDAAKYVESVSLNGKPLEGFTIRHEDIVAGGVLEFTMTDKPKQ